MSKISQRSKLALSILAAAMAVPAVSQAALVEDSKASLELRNMYLNRDFRSNTAVVNPSYGETWGQGFIAKFESGFTEGAVGVGVDAIGMLGVKLDSGKSRTAGNMLPVGADAVVMIEHTERADSTTLLILKAVAPKENVVAQGEDMRSGQIVVSKGQCLGSAEIGALAACGHDTISVFSMIKVGIISTGDELVDVAARTTAAQIRDINSYALAAKVIEGGHIAKRYGIVPDVYERLYECLHKAVQECQIVLVSGGSSVGARDHTVQAIEKLAGQKVLFHGLAVKPGKPTIFGMIGAVPVFGLPGHPVSAITIYDQIVKPVVAHLAGTVITRPPFTYLAKISRNVPSAPGRDDIIRVRLVATNEGYVAEPVFGKSGLISTLVKADGTVRIASEAGGLYAGDTVRVELLHPVP